MATTYTVHLTAENYLSTGERYYHSVPVEGLWLAAILAQTMLRIQKRGGFTVADVDILPTTEPAVYTMADYATL